VGLNDIAVFGLSSSRRFAEGMAHALGVSLVQHEERDFEDGEHKIRPLQSVRNRDAYVVQSLYSDGEQSINDKLVRLLFFIGCLKDAGAARVTVLAPYLGYTRKDRKTQARDPVTTRYMAQLLEAVGTDRTVTLEVHNLAAFQNAFRCATEHLIPDSLFLVPLVRSLAHGETVTILSPDAGGVKRAERFRRTLGERLERKLPLAFMEKARGKGLLEIGRLVGEVVDSTVVIVDDLISTGGTLLGAARACKGAGATRVLAVAAHGLFVGKANEVLAAEELDQVFVTDTIPAFRLDPALGQRKVTQVTATGLFASAIRGLHAGESLLALRDG
jgi:ribose-phosphate pyrophosphokinase